MNQNNQSNEIIRYLAFVLRHRPHEAKLKLNDGGWAEISKLIDALSRFKKIKITESELVSLINSKSKNSFSISEDEKMVKAKSGHTALFGFTEASKVPNVIFTHIFKNQISTVFASGLMVKPGEYLIERADSAPAKDMVLVTINTSKARSAKVKFYCKDNLFFAFHVPANCLTFSSF